MENKDELYYLSRVDLAYKFNHEFINNYKEKDYKKEDYDKLLSIQKNFNDNIYSSEVPVELYLNSIMYLDKVKKTNFDDIDSLSRIDIQNKFNFEFEEKFYSSNYSKENWNRITQIKDNFNENISNSIMYLELYKNTIDNLEKIPVLSKKGKNASYVYKNLYDYTSEELQEKFNKEFDEKYQPFHYTEENWEKILEIYKQFNGNILQTGFPLTLFTDSRYKLSQVEKIAKEDTFSQKMVSKLDDIAHAIGKGVSVTYSTVKFAFRILVLNVSSVIITLFIHLILGTFIYSILPRFVNDFMLQSVIAALLFVIFNVMLFLDQDDKNVLNNHKIQILKHGLTVPFYSLIFLIFTMLPELPVLEELFPVFYPQMWLSAFTEEYVFSPMIALSINCAVSILIYLFIRRRTEY